MRAPCHRLQREVRHVPTAEAQRAPPREHPPARLRGPIVDGCIDEPTFAFDTPADDGLVALADGALTEGARELKERGLGLGTQQQPRRGLVEPVDDVRSVQRARRARRRRRECMHDGCAHGATRCAAGWRVRHHARGLDTHSEVLVLVGDGHIERRSPSRRETRRHSGLQLEDVARRHAGDASSLTPVEKHASAAAGLACARH